MAGIFNQDFWKQFDNIKEDSTVAVAENTVSNLPTRAERKQRDHLNIPYQVANQEQSVKIDAPEIDLYAVEVISVVEDDDNEIIADVSVSFIRRCAKHLIAGIIIILAAMTALMYMNRGMGDISDHKEDSNVVAIEQRELAEQNFRERVSRTTYVINPNHYIEEYLRYEPSYYNSFYANAEK